MQKKLSNDIQERGFFIQKKFLNTNEINLLHNHYLSSDLSDNKNYPVRTLDLAKIPIDVLDRINKLKCDCFPKINSDITNAVFFSITTSDLQNSINSDFHQDHESYYFQADHLHYLNFYMIIKKDDVDNSNLDIIPMDNLAKVDKRFSELVIGSGASLISNQCYYLQSINLSYKFKFDISSIIETPKLDVGDLLILRGDLIHRTQNQLGNRIALSVRTGRSDIIVSKNRYYPTSLNHLHFIKNNIKPYAKWAFLFKMANLDFMTLAELRAMYSKIGMDYTEEIETKYNKFLSAYTEFLNIYERDEKNRQKIIDEINL